MGRRFMGEDDKLKTLVGIVADVRAALQSDPPPTAYYPYWQRVPDGVALVVRTTADPRAAAGALRAALRSEDAQLPIQAIRTMEEVVDRSVAAAQIPVDARWSSLPLPRCWWPALAFTASSPTRWPAAGMKSASGWRSARSARNCSGWSFARV